MVDLSIYFDDSHGSIVEDFTVQYKQLDGIKYFKASSQQKFFKQHIDGIAHMSEKSLMEYANQGKKVAEMFSTKVWNETMEMIESK